MRHIILGANDTIGPWVSRETGGSYVPGSGQTIALFDGDNLLAAVLYDTFNGANIHMSVAAVPGARWLNREFLRVAFEYPFLQLGVKRITGMVAESNHQARKFDEHLGMELEATLLNAHPDGNLLIYVMHRDKCRWINNVRLKNG